MPRGVKKAMLVEIPEENSEKNLEENSEELTPEQQDTEDILEESRADQPKHPYDVVYRVDELTGEEGWVGRFPTAAVTPEFLAKRFGPGKYRRYQRKPNKTGKYVGAGSKVTVVSADLRPTIQQGTPPTSDSGSGDFSRDLLLSMMKQGQENSQNMVQMMATMMTAMTTAFSSLKPSVDPVMLEVLRGSINRKDPTEIATALLSVMRENTPGGKDPIEQLKSLLEVKELLGGDGGGDPESAMILKGMETLQSLFAGGRAFQPPPAAVAAVPPVPVVPPPPPVPAPQLPRVEAPQPVTIDPNVRAWKRGVLQNLPMLIQASAFMPPHAAAETAKEQMQAAGAWADLVEDVKSDYPNVALDALPDDFGNAFVERAAKDLQLADLPESPREWARETLYHLAELAVEPDEEEADDATT